LLIQEKGVYDTRPHLGVSSRQNGRSLLRRRKSAKERSAPASGGANIGIVAQKDRAGFSQARIWQAVARVPHWHTGIVADVRANVTVVDGHANVRAGAAPAPSLAPNLLKRRQRKTRCVHI